MRYALTTCIPHAATAPRARALTANCAYQRAINDVYIHGSEEANALSTLMAEALPGTSIGYGNSIALKKVDGEIVDATYKALLLRACIEASPDPRKTCEDTWNRGSRGP